MTHDPTAGTPELLSRLVRGRLADHPVLLALMALNVLVFLAMLAQGAGWSHHGNAIQLAWGANFGPATQDGQWWRLLSALFLHFGVLHLALNMWALWDVGRLMERLHGPLRFALLYLGAGVVGNLLSLVAQGNRAVSGGASGAVFGLYGALLVFLWRERRHVHRGEFRWLFGAALLFTVVTLVMGQIVPGIDNAAHVGGWLAGMLLGQALARPWPGHPQPLPPVGRGVAAALVLVAIGLLVRELPAPSYHLSAELQAQQLIRRFLQEDQLLSQRWEALMDPRRRAPMRIEELADAIDTRVTDAYRKSFEDLSKLRLEPAAPSAPMLQSLRAYARLRADAARTLAEGLRTRDAAKVREALERVRQAPLVTRGASVPAVGSSRAAGGPAGGNLDGAATP